MRLGLCLAPLLLLSVGMTNAAEDAIVEVCQPWMPPVATGPSKPSAPPPVPTEFNPVHGGTAGPALVFLGDSLTAGEGARFPRDTASRLGDRAFTAYAIGSQPSGVLSRLFRNETVGPDEVGMIWIGRNNNPDDQAQLIADIDAAIAHVPSGKYLVLSVLSGRYDGEQPGQKRRGSIDALNAQLATRYGDRFVAARPLLACADFKDNIHLVPGGYDRIAAAVAEAIAAKGW